MFMMKMIVVFFPLQIKDNALRLVYSQVIICLFFSLMTQKCSGTQLGGKLRHTRWEWGSWQNNVRLSIKCDWCQIFVSNKVKNFHI